jgi:hypothetical protein
VKKVGLVWGAAMMLAATTQTAAPKNGAQTANGAAGAAATPAGGTLAPTPTGGAAGTTPTPTPSASSSASATPETPPPTDGGVSGAQEPVPTPPAASAAQADSAEDEEEEAEREAARKKRKRRRQRELEAAAAAEREEEESRVPSPPVTPPGKRWHLMGSHVLISAERMTNVLSWSTTESYQVETSSFGQPATSSVDLERSGTDVSFLGSGGVSQNPFAVPRIAIDGMFNNGLTLGGSLSYMVTSGKHESTSGTTKSSTDDPTLSLFVLAPRIGVMIPASPSVSVWLRGGITRVSASSDSHPFDPSTGEALTSHVTSTVTFVDLTLDPQLVISPLPHVGITLGAALDIGVGGTSETSLSSTTQDIKGSSYGITGGLVAIF